MLCGVPGSEAQTPTAPQSQALDGAALKAEIASLTLDQARAIGAQTLQAGRQDIALVVADHILALAPQDSFGHFLKAQAFLRAGQPSKARAPARLAFRHAQSDVQKFEAARLAAALAAQDKKFLPGQIWMRRAIQAAPSDQARQAAAQDFRAIRHHAPLSLKFNLSVSPSDNVNGGANEAKHEVDGLDMTGLLSPDALALSGVITRASAVAGYRLQRTQTSETRAVMIGSAQHVSLSDEAKDTAPNAKNHDYGYRTIEAGISHVQAIGTAGTRISFGAFAGRGWLGGTHSYDSTRLFLGLTQPLSERTTLHLSRNNRNQRDAEFAVKDLKDQTWSLGLSFQLANADQLSAHIFSGEIDSQNTQSARTNKGLSLGYSRAKPLGPVSLSASIKAEERRYEDYAVIFPVPGGRQDTQITGAIDMGVAPLSVYGFVPTVTVSRDRTRSNVSRFDIDSTSVSLGLKSEF